MSVAANGFLGIMTEIRKCLFNSLFYLFYTCQVTVTLTTCCVFLLISRTLMQTQALDCDCNNQKPKDSPSDWVQRVWRSCQTFPRVVCAVIVSSGQQNLKQNHKVLKIRLNVSCVVSYTIWPFPGTLQHWKRVMKQKNGHHAIASDERDTGGYLPWEYLTGKHLIYCLLAHGNGTSKLGKPQINSHCIYNIIWNRIFSGAIANDTGSHPCLVEEETILWYTFQYRLLHWKNLPSIYKIVISEIFFLSSSLPGDCKKSFKKPVSATLPMTWRTFKIT